MGELAGLLVSQGVGVASSAANTYSQNNAARAQQGFANSGTEINSQWSQIQQQQLLSRGDIAGSRARLGYQQLASTQRAAYAGSGVDVNTGSAAAVQSESRTLGEIERLQVQQSAYNQALGLKAENMAAVGQNQMRQLAMRNGIRQSYGQVGSQVAGAALRSGYYAEKYQGLGQKPATPETALQSINRNGPLVGPDLMTPQTPYDELLNRRRTENA